MHTVLRTTLPFVTVAALAACDSMFGAPAVEQPPALPFTPPAAQAPVAAAPIDEHVLGTVLARGIGAPRGSDGTYDVDPFVAAYLFESLLQDRDRSSFTHVQAAGAAPEGYRVEPAIAGSVWAQLGLVPGDVVVAIEGVPVTATDAVLLALRGAERQLRVEVHRDDFSFTNLYRMNAGLAWRTLLADLEGGKVRIEPTPSGTEVPAIAPPDREPLPSQSDDEVPPLVRTESSRVDAVVQPSASITVEPKPASRPVVVEPKPASKPRPQPVAASKPKPSAEPTPRPTRVDDQPADLWCTSASSCTIARAAYDRMMAAPERLVSEADVVPAIRDDVFSGYRIKSVKAGGAAARLGFRAGDKVTHINGRDLTDEAEAIGLYVSLQSTTVFRVRYERDGTVLTKTITIE